MDDHEFEKVYWALYPGLLRYAQFHEGLDGAEDAVSSTLTTLWFKRLEFPATREAESQLRALAFRILQGHLSNAGRSKGRRQRLSARLATLRPSLSLPGDPAREVVSLEAVERMLSRLSPRDREVVLLGLAAGMCVRNC